MALPTYVAPGQSYLTPEMLAAQNAAGATVGGPNLTDQLVGNLSGALKGELPDDTKQLLQQKAAQDAVSSGTSGSQFANYQGLRTLGLTSLDRMQHAEDSLVNPLIGYHPPFIQPQRQYSPPVVANQGGGGFENTTPHYNVGPIGGGGGGGGGRAPTLPTYQTAPGGGTSTGNVASDLVAKYGPLGNSGASPMGQYGGPALSPVGGYGGIPGGGLNNWNSGGITDEDRAMAQEQQNLIDVGLNPADFGYGPQPVQNLEYSDQPSAQVLADQAIYE
jgi:hypothetical protein